MWTRSRPFQLPRSLLSLCVLTIVFISRTSSKECSLYESFRDSRCLEGSELEKQLTNSNSAWVVEFYSSWCGHCQQFAPTWKEVATRVKGWRRVIRVGQIDCTTSENRGACKDFEITAFPTIKFFPANSHEPRNIKSNQYQGKRRTESVVEAIVNYIESHSLVSSLVPVNESKSIIESSKLLVLVFEREGSYLGRELVLDCYSQEDLEVKRILPKNKVLVKHYSILEFPTIVVQKQDGNFVVLRGNSMDGKDLVAYYLKKIDEYLSKHIKPNTSKKHVDNDRHSTSQLSSVKKYAAIARPTVKDISSAVSYALRMEVSLHSIVSGSAFSALFKFVQVLEQTLQISACPKLHSGLSLLRSKLDSRLYSGFVVVSELLRVVETRLDQTVFPLHPVWESCTGSKPSYRGFPCGLWSLMHTATVLSLTNGTSSSPTSSPMSHFNTREVLNALVDFVRNFFSCEPCRKHFSLMADKLKSHPLSYNGDAVLWLWEAHNKVNQRLQGDISSDPRHPKVPFPPHNLCPYCYISTHPELTKWADYVDFNEVAFAPGESLLQQQEGTNLSNSKTTPSYLWNKTAVFLFLYNFYIPADNPHQPLDTILQAAWPRSYPLSQANHKLVRASRSAGGLHHLSRHDTPNHYDVPIIKCLMIIATIAVIIFWLLRKRQCYHFLRLFVTRKLLYAASVLNLSRDKQHHHLCPHTSKLKV